MPDENQPETKPANGEPQQGETLSKLITAFEEVHRPTRDYVTGYSCHSEEVLRKIGIKFTLADIESLIDYVWAGEYDKKEYVLGMFITAAYNMINDEVIIFDRDLDITYLGMGLAEDKILVNLRKVACVLGSFSKGAVLHYGAAGDGMGANSPGININYGIVNWMLESYGMKLEPYRNNRGLFLNYENYTYSLNLHLPKFHLKVDNSDWSLGKFGSGLDKDNLTMDIPELRNYFASLLPRFESGKECPEKGIELIRGLGKNPMKMIREEIFDIFLRNGFSDMIYGRGAKKDTTISW